MPSEPSETASRQSLLDRVSDGSLDVFAAIRLLDESSGIDEAKRKGDGVVYTPRRVADFMVSLIDPSEGSILEPSCGRGVFVFSMAERVLSDAGPEAVASLSSRLSCAELDDRAVDDFLELWKAWSAANGLSVPPPRTVRGDSLFGSLSSERFDKIIGNPPYVRFQNLSSEYRTRLQKAFSSCSKGNVDVYYAFVEFSLSVAKHVCLVVPNSWLSTRSASILRDVVRPRIDALVDFGDELIFAPVRAYASILLCGSSDDVPAQVRLSLGMPDGDAWTLSSRDGPALSGQRWTVSPASLSGSSGKIGDRARIHSGIATLADSVFKIRANSVSNGLVSFMGGRNGDAPMSVPERYAPRLVKLTKVSKAEELLVDQRVLYPYDASGKLVSESELRKDAPDLLAHLEWQRDRLLSRDAGDVSKHEAWYAYGRRQGLAPLPSGRLVALSGMSRDGLRPFVFDSGETGRFLFTSGFVLSPVEGVSPEELVAALSSPDFWTWILANGKEWASANKNEAYRSYGSKLLASAPFFPAEVEESAS